MAQEIKQYDVVRIVRILNDAAARESPFGQRPPRIGDEATVLEIYTDPPGYELECSGSDGVTIWLGGYSPNDLELQRVGANPSE